MRLTGNQHQLTPILSLYRVGLAIRRRYAEVLSRRPRVESDVRSVLDAWATVKWLYLAARKHPR